MNEAAKAMLRQILKMNKSSRLESKMSNANGFLIDNVHPSSDVLDSGSSANRLSAVTLSEVLPNTAALSEIHSSSCLANGKAYDTLFPKENTMVPDLFPAPGLTQGENTDHHNGAFKEAQSIDFGYGDTIPGFIDAPIPVASDELLVDDIDIFLDDIHKLPGKEQQMEQETEWNKIKNLNNLTEQMGLLASATRSG
ncbi:UNVERIFIED_CONTAM: Heat stress transcription factor A-1 [Sesamum latifolium]|uniref:Heat stress transcription factor A-1 n=1 Tax=Sesamum latifolium TaxID=2727402 RepID=A0AAW2TA06_9LAMI